MLMDTIVKDIKNLVIGSTIKMDSIAKQYETLESISYSDEYISAVQKTDRFDLYTSFDIDAVGDAFRNINGQIIISSDTQLHYANNPSAIPLAYRDKVLEVQRQYIIDNYIEINNYYRMLSGLPNIESEEKDFIRLTEEERLRAGIDTDAFIHQLSNDDIYLIEECGLLNELIVKYPNYKYLNYLGTNKVDVVTARITNNFGILKLNNKSVPDAFYNTFLQTYEQCREYFMTVIYIQNFNNNYKMYDNFIGLCIMFMTIQRVISNTFKFGIQREFYDWSFIQNIYKMYNVPFIDNLPIEYHMIILKNLNNLLRYKSTDKVLFDIAALLGYERIDIFKYYLVKKHRLDENEEPLFFYKQKTDEDGNLLFDVNNNPIYVEDYEKMYEVYFQKVDLKEPNLSLALQDETNKLKYNEVILEDPYWYEDANLTKMKYEEAYNYVETKYISLNLMYRMTEMLFELTYAFRMIIDKKNEIDNLYVSIPKIYMNAEFKLFDIIIFLVSLTCKLNGFKDGIITTPSKISHIYGFNFDAEVIDRIKSIILDNPKLIDQSLLNYFNKLTIEKPEDVNKLFENIRDYNNFIIDKMRQSQDIRQYNLYKQIFKISMISETQTSMFNITRYNEDGELIEDRVATTYLEYLEYESPILAQLVKTSNRDDIPAMIEHLTSVINDFMESLQYLFFINDNNNPVFTALTSLINFFKSYTVDLNSFNIIYLFDSKYYNMLKIIEDIELIDAHIAIDGTLNQLYGDDTYTIGASLDGYKDSYKFSDDYKTKLVFELNDGNISCDDKINYIDSTIQYKGSLDHQYSNDLLISDISMCGKDKATMHDNLTLSWSN